MIPIFEVNHLNVSLKVRKGRQAIVKDVSFSVKEGECLGVLGESGSGKSMSVKAAMGLLDKNFEITGSAKFMGEELVGKNSEEMRKIRGGRVGIVLQNPMTSFDPLYRIGNQIAETYSVHTDWDAKRIREESLKMLEKMQIRNPEEVLEKYPHQLSGGMLQRIMIGIATSMNPSLIIADEPTTAIDAITQYEILEEFVRIKKENKAGMIFISHDLNAISRVADKIVVLNQGRVVDKGDFQHILHNAKDSYTKLLVDKRTAVMKKYKNALVGVEVKNA